MTGLALSQPIPGADDESKAFLDWANSLPPEAVPQSGSALFNAYKRIEDGDAPAEAEQLVARLRQHAMSNPEFSTLFYNRQYAARNPMYASGPNAFLVEAVERLRPGRALDVGIGDGR